MVFKYLIIGMKIQIIGILSALLILIPGAVMIGGVTLTEAYEQNMTNVFLILIPLALIINGFMFNTFKLWIFK